VKLLHSVWGEYALIRALRCHLSGGNTVETDPKNACCGPPGVGKSVPIREITGVLNYEVCNQSIEIAIASFDGN
jgi:Fe-S cluster assembly ATPase SufC